MSTDPEFPWMFHRNEVDLLEEDLDDLYDLFLEPGMLDQLMDQSESLLTMEQLCIREQMETEERAEAEFMLRTDPTLFLESKIESRDSTFRPKEHSLTHELVRENFRPPFYEQVFRWTTDVFVAAKNVYEQSHPSSEAAFRIYLNVKLVPIKLSAGLTEESTEEAIGDEIAEKEYQLALVYLDRVLNSFVSLEEIGDHTFTPFLKKGFEIKQILKELLGRVRRRKQHMQNGFV